MGAHDIVADPLFIAPSLTALANFALQSASPAIHAANPAYPIATDFNGNPRPSNGGYDIGAFQF
jgi:hypothetical protein